MNPLSKHLACLLLFLPCIPSARAADDEAWRAIIARWKQAASIEIENTKDALELESSAKEMRAWLSSGEAVLPTEDNARWHAANITFDFILARGWAAAGDHGKALQHLKAQAAQPGPFLHETRNPDYFALDVFKLHSEIMAHTGKVADIPYSGYQVFQGPSSEGVTRYLFVWEPKEMEINGITVEGIDEDEQRQMIHLTECGADKRCHLSDGAQVFSKRGKLKVFTAERPDGFVLVLNGVSKVVGYKGEFQVPFVHPSPRTKIDLRIDKGELEQPLDAIARMEQKAKPAK